MNVKTFNLVLLIVILAFSVTSCGTSQTTSIQKDDLDLVLQSTIEAINTQTVQVSAESTDRSGNITPELSQVVFPQKVGPDTYPQGVNPLTGLHETSLDLLSLPPALISISNFPPSARKVQGGLGTAAQVYEVFIGEGMTRFLAVFYGAYPDPNVLPPAQNMTVVRPTRIGPIRSGRTAYESIRAHLNGFLVMASADINVRAQLSGTTNIFGSDSNDINSAMIDVSQLIDIAGEAEKPVTTELLSGNLFSDVVPSEGVPANKLWVFYNALDQVLWEYQPDLRGYYRYQDNADESGKYTLAMDAFTGQPLLYENVIVLFAEHEFKKPTQINIKLDFITQGKALLFRDGLMFKIYWTTRSGEFEQTTGLVRPIRYTNYYNEAFPLKPGQTWIHLVDINHRYWEADPARPFEALAGSTFWSVRFYDSSKK